MFTLTVSHPVISDPYVRYRTFHDIMAINKYDIRPPPQAPFEMSVFLPPEEMWMDASEASGNDRMESVILFVVFKGVLGNVVGWLAV